MQNAKSAAPLQLPLEGYVRLPQVIATNPQALPPTGFLRLSAIIGNPKAVPPIPALIPVSKSTWWSGVKSKRYPQPVRTLGLRITAWRVEDIRTLISAAGGQAKNGGKQ